MATHTMTMNKTIHCAIRRDLARFAAALAAFPADDRSRAEALHRAWRNFHAQLSEHHEGEHEVAWPALQAIGVPMASITTFDEEHHAMATALDQADIAMEKLVHDGHQVRTPMPPRRRSPRSPSRRRRTSTTRSRRSSSC